MPVAYRGNQFKNWLQLQFVPWAQMHGIPSSPPKNKGSSKRMILYFFRRRDSNIKCDMPVAYRGNQFKNWLQLQFVP